MSAVLTRPRPRLHSEPFTDYVQIRATNWSRLKYLADSPLRYRYHETTPREDTPAMALGRLIHSAVLEPDTLPLLYAVYDGGRRGTNDYKAWLAQQGDRQIVTVAEYEKALAIRDAVNKHREARRLLRGGRSEVTLQWIDEETRVRCKARLDHLRGDVLTDLKSTTDIDARAFGRTAQRLAYHGQFGFYRLGLLATGHEPAPMYVIAAESEPPHDVGVFEVDEDTLFVGVLEARSLLRRLQECRRRRRWPGRYPDIERLDFPSWALAADSDYSDISDLGMELEVRGVTA